MVGPRGERLLSLKSGIFGARRGPLTSARVPGYPASVASSAAYSRARGRVSRICDSACDDRTLRLELLDAIRRVAGFDAYAWLVTDPETSVGSAPLADVPCLPELPVLIRLKYLTTVNRWTALRGRVGLLAEATGGDLSRSRMWRDLLCRYAVSDMASSVYRDRFGCWGFLDLWRTGPAGRFDAAEAGFLSLIAPQVTAALRRSQAGTFTQGAARELIPPGPVVLLLSRDLDVRAQTPKTQRYLRTLVPPEAGQPPVPASAYNVAAQLLASEAGVDPNPPSARVHLSHGLWLTLRAGRIGNAGAPEERDIAVSIEETSPAERLALFSRAFGLSTREGELLRYLASGSDTRDLARQMFVSEHTVQDHLKSIFAKTSARSRGMLLSRALGT
jgi:DNA-binding CsgD family transcriptional regulator